MPLSGRGRPIRRKLWALGAPDEARVRVTDRAERERLLRFLTDGGTVVERAAGLAPDRLDASEGRVVPITTVTDGVWIWTGAHAYYLERYGYGPDPEFHAYIASRDYRADEPGEGIGAAAREFLRRGRTRPVRPAPSRSSGSRRGVGRGRT